MRLNFIFTLKFKHRILNPIQFTYVQKYSICSIGRMRTSIMLIDVLYEENKIN